jgi:hypothetical protein
LVCRIVGLLQNRVLRGMCGSERKEVTGGWGKMHKEGLHDLYWGDNMEDVIGGTCRMGQIRNS